MSPNDKVTKSDKTQEKVTKKQKEPKEPKKQKDPKPKVEESKTEVEEPKIVEIEAEVTSEVPEKKEKVPLTKEEKAEKKRLKNEKLYEEYSLLIEQKEEELKELKKKRRKVKPRKVPKNSGIEKPVGISKELAKYISWDNSQPISRPNVIKKLSEIFDKKELKKGISIDVQNDKKLHKLLGEPVHLINSKKPELGNGYSWNNLQKYLKDHFVKETKVSE